MNDLKPVENCRECRHRENPEPDAGYCNKGGFTIAKLAGLELTHFPSSCPLQRYDLPTVEQCDQVIAAIDSAVSQIDKAMKALGLIAKRSR